jgi:hypothetical protein
MYKYADFKHALNASPSAHTFGKSRILGSALGSVSEYTLLWDATNGGAGFKRSIHVQDRSSFIENAFLSIQTLARYSFSEILQRLNATPGTYYTLQCGGSSSTNLLIKAPAAVDESTLSINALHFLHQIGWTPSCSEDDERAMSIPLSLRSVYVHWLTPEAIAAAVAAAPAALPVHWVWFRKPGYRLTQEIIERATSWIAVNPDCTFHLWTDIPTAADVDDFLSDLKPDWRTHFLAHTTVHLADETAALIEASLADFTDDTTAAGIATLRAEFASPQRQARVYKTDFARLFILWTHGGVYCDFNDLLCLAPVRQLFATYDPTKPLGVSDLADLNHATNYFLYSPARNAEWGAILRAMIADVPALARMIRDPEMAAVMRSTTETVLRNCARAEYTACDVLALQTCFGRMQLPYIGNEHISDALFERMPYIILCDLAPDAHKHVFRTRMDWIRRPPRATRRGGASAAPPAFPTLDEVGIAAVQERITEVFEAQFLFWWTDFNLRTLMHFTNLPIYCRMRKMHLEMIPYGYYMSYACMVSWVGHIGDGTSYGMDGRKDVHASIVYGAAGCGAPTGSA